MTQRFFSKWISKLKQQKINLFDSGKNIVDKFIIKFSENGFYRTSFRADLLLISDPTAIF